MDRGDRTWPPGRGGARRSEGSDRPLSTAWSRGKEGTQSGRDSGVWNVETPSGSGRMLWHSPGRPTVRRAEALGGNRMPNKPMPVVERRQETLGRVVGPPPIAET